MLCFLFEWGKLVGDSGSVDCWICLVDLLMLLVIDWWWRIHGAIGQRRWWCS